uniref:Uncharacterized protein n=1 Tax=Panthera tigris altaica TaxID=74533 RepID=A0A8C9JNS4_PANTA
MLSRSMTNEAIAVLTPNGISFPQTGEPKPTNQRQYNLKKQLKAEVKVLGVQSSVVANILSSLCALVGFILLSVTLDAVDPAFRKCTFNKEQRKPERTTFNYYINPYMDKECITAKTTLTGTLSVMLIYTALEFCLAALSAVIWWKE